MGIVNFPDRTIYTKQPKIYVYNNNTAVSGTYYTTVNATNTRGKITKISLTIASSNNSVLNIRVTIDGITNLIGIPSNNASVGLAHADENTAGSYNALQSIDYFCDIVFYNSCLVEFMQNVGSTIGLYGSIMYSTE